jgi:hypothetical protein
MKTCNKCHIEKTYAEFSKDKTRRDGYANRCKVCLKEVVKQWQRDNKDRHLEFCNNTKQLIQPGIYQIKCLVNGKRYIGQSIIPNRRKYDHFSVGKPNNSNRLLQIDMEKYGKQSFVFGIIEHCEPELLLERETYYIKSLKPEYNYE